MGTLTVAFLVSVLTGATANGGQFLSHPPQRPLPTASSRPLGQGPAFFVDPAKGHDTHDGSQAKPWKTVQHGLQGLKPGDTLYLRGGTYYERLKVDLQGNKDKPITLRAFPGELPILDGGFREFFDNPAAAWQPVADGAPGEYQSTRVYPGIEKAVGYFGDSMVPLHCYRSLSDFRSTNEFAKGKDPLYVGPGCFYDPATQRIHIRLAHTHIQAYGLDNYRGATDPRKLPLVIAGYNQQPLWLEGCRHLRIQDLVVRGAGINTVLIRNGVDIELDGLTLYSGDRCLRVETTEKLRVFNTAFRGTHPPWGSRTASKYRALDSHLFVPVGTYETERTKRKYLTPQCRDFEIAFCEFTDGHDGPYVGGVLGLRFHHNLVDNMNDDGIYLSAWGPPGGDVHIYQNYISRCLTAFAFGLGRGSESDPGTGTWIYRNVLDLRGTVVYQHPGPDNPPELPPSSRVCGDHGGPVWEPMFIYHNTVVVRSGQMTGYAFGWGGHLGKPARRVFNNILVQTDGLPRADLPSADFDFQADGNLHWSRAKFMPPEKGFFAGFRQSRMFEASKRNYPAGWESQGQLADPRFLKWTENWRTSDFRLQAGSPAIDAGVPLPADWPDPLRQQDAGKPDVGAFPAGITSAHFGLKKGKN